VIATGKNHSVKDFAEIAFQHVGLNWKNHVVVDPKYLRPAEVHLLLGNSEKGRKELGWSPKLDFEGLVRLMVDSDVQLVSQLLQQKEKI
jgi:GDPmannose 4,6-dehydratase